jgi:hypothetical protein
MAANNFFREASASNLPNQVGDEGSLLSVASIMVALSVVGFMAFALAFSC